MGNAQCCSPLNRPPGPCIASPKIQCQENFIDQCDGVNNICTTFIQTDSGQNSLICGSSSDQTCCFPNPAFPSLSAWLWDDPSNTCAQTASCVDVDISKCIPLNKNQADVCAGSAGGNISTIKTKELSITCKWPISSFDTLEAVQTWQKQFDQNNPAIKTVFDTQIMPYFCSLIQGDLPDQTNCPTNNNEGPNAWVDGICSPFVALNDTGNFCKSWLSGLSNQSDIVKSVNDKALIGYCDNLSNLTVNRNRISGLKNGEVNECLCINRGKDPNGEFNQIVNAITNNPETRDEVNSLGAVGCWYAPCNSGINQLLPLKDETTQPIYYPTDCPNVCRIINNIKGVLEDDKIIENIDCKNAPPDQPNGSGGTTGDIRSFWDRYKWIIIGIIIGVIFLLGFIIIFIVIEEERKS